MVVWCRPFAIVKNREPLTPPWGDEGAFPWISASPDTILRELAEEVPFDALGLAWLAAAAWQPCFETDEHDDPRGLLIASRAHLTLAPKAPPRPADQPMFLGEPYDVWTASISGVWAPRPSSIGEVCEALCTHLSPDERHGAERERARLPHQYRLDEDWLPKLLEIVLHTKILPGVRAAFAMGPKVGFALGDRVHHADHGDGTVRKILPEQHLDIAFDRGFTRTLSFDDVRHVE